MTRGKNYFDIFDNFLCFELFDNVFVNKKIKIITNMF